jgi:hypothetical protein
LTKITTAAISFYLPSAYYNRSALKTQGMLNMLRWLFLIVTFVAWIASMAVVWDHYGPREAKEGEMPGARTALEALFSENAEPEQSWKLYVDEQYLRGLSTGESKELKSIPLWNGRDELALIKVGSLETSLKQHETQVEETTRLRISLPFAGETPLFQFLGDMSYESWSSISMDQGLESFSSKFRMPLGLEARTIGVRQGAELVVTQQVWQNGTSLFPAQQDHISVGRKGAPVLEILPFQRNPKIAVGHSWDIAVLDTNLDINRLARPQIVVLRARCTSCRRIVYEGREVTAFEVRAGNQASAWYSADGVVLKQLYRIVNLLEVMVVRTEAKNRGEGNPWPAKQQPR